MCILRHILLIILLIPFSSASAFEVNKTNSGVDIKWSTSDETYYVNEAGGPAGSLASIQAGAQAWTDVSASSFTFIYSGATTSTAHGINDGSNIILFGPIETAGVLARNSYWYSSSTGEIIDSDIKFNTNYTWATDGSVTAHDIQSIATHEMGHSLSLKDLYNDSDSEKTMYYGSAKGEIKKRTLDQDDINGISYLYADNTPVQIPLPTTQQNFTYLPIDTPVTNIDPSLAKPVGVGSVASGGPSVTLKIATAEFAGKVDAYFVLYAPSIDSINIYTLKSDYTFQPLTAGLVAWKTEITGPLDETLFGDIPTVFLTGTYYFGLLTAPAGSDLSSYYLWITSFEVTSPSP